MFALIREQNYFLFEVLLAFRLVAIVLPLMTSSIFIQDKICYVSHGQTSTFCQNIEQKANSTEQQHMKDVILTESAKFGTYKLLIETIPEVLWCLFLGPFLDNFASASYIIFLISTIGDICCALINLVLIYFYESSPYYLLIPSVTNWLTGGLNAFTTTAGLYITVTTTEQNRAFKFMALEVIVFSSVALASFVGGQLLQIVDNPLPLRTYHYNYLLTLLLNSISLVVLFSLFVVDKVKRKDESMKQTQEPNQKLDQNYADDAQTHIKTLNQSTENDSQETQNQSIIKTLLNLDNIRQTFKCFFKRRPNNVRLQIFLLCFIIYGQSLITNGRDSMMVQFAQILYHWSPSKYTTVSVIKLVADMVLLFILSFIFIVKLKLQDSTLICMAQMSNFCADFVRGTFLSVAAYFASIPIGAASLFGTISAKSKLSKIIPKEEVGKIYSLNAVVEAMIPLVSSLIYSNLFALSVSTYPGLIYHFSCALMILTIGVLIIERIFCPVRSHEEEMQKQQNSVQP